LSAQPREQHYIPELQLGTRVYVRGIGSAAVHTATVIRALENPSEKPENQWYDVKFEGGRLSRFHASFLRPIPKS